MESYSSLRKKTPASTSPVSNDYTNQEQAKREGGAPTYRNSAFGPVNSVTGNPQARDQFDSETRNMTNNVVDWRLAERQMTTPYKQNYSTGLGTGVAPVNVLAEQRRNADREAEFDQLRAENRAAFDRAKSMGMSPTTYRVGNVQFNQEPTWQQRNRAYDKAEAQKEAQANRTTNARFRAGLLGRTPEEQMSFAMQRAMGVNPMAAMQSFGSGMKELGSNQTAMDLKELDNSARNREAAIEEMKAKGMISQAEAANELRKLENARLAKNDDRRFGLDLFNAQGGMLDRQSKLAQQQAELERQRQLATADGRAREVREQALREGKSPAVANELANEAAGKRTPSDARAITDDNEYFALSKEFYDANPNAGPAEFGTWLASRNLYVPESKSRELRSGSSRNAVMGALFPWYMNSFFGWDRDQQRNASRSPNGYPLSPQPSPVPASPGDRDQFSGQEAAVEASRKQYEMLNKQLEEMQKSMGVLR